jgi:putative tryptophan/tyrosine transport system substrate-binding protein
MQRRGSRLSRRLFLTGAAGLGLLAGCGRWPWQAPARVYQIGYLSPSSPTDDAPMVEAFRQGMGERGYLEGQNLAIDYRYTYGHADQLRDLAGELDRLRVDVILARGTLATQAAKEATSLIPIVFANAGDPVGDGLVASLARPGGHVTGLSALVVDLSAKRLQLLQEAVPGIARVAWLRDPGVGTGQGVNPMEETTRSLGLELLPLAVHGPGDLDSAFEAATRERADAVLMGGGPIALNEVTRVVSLAAKYRLPTIYQFKDPVVAGGLMAYGVYLPDQFRRAAYYVDRILKGAKPADLPIEQPMTFDFVVNMKTARELGISFPNEIMLQVTEVIE